MEAEAAQLAAQLNGLADRLAHRHFPEVARALHASVPDVVCAWRARCIDAMPDLDHMSIAEFEGSIATTLHSLASAMECNDASRLRLLLDESPARGLARFAQRCGTETLLAEERILRSVVVIEMRSKLGRPPTAEESSSLHDLLDLMGEQSLLALINLRREQRDQELESRMSGMHRLADLGMLVAGVAHDASNLLLPLRMRLEHLRAAELAPKAREDLVAVELIVGQFQNSIVNLRWLTVDSSRSPTSSGRARPGGSLRLDQWAKEAAEFHRRILPPEVELTFDIAADLPPVAMPSAALSQAVFNLVQNAAQAIAADATGIAGRIVVRARARADAGADLTIEDNGPGMSPEVLRRGTEAFFTTREQGTGLGLSLVRALVLGCGGTITFVSPPPGKTRGTSVAIALPPVKRR